MTTCIHCGKPNRRGSLCPDCWSKISGEVVKRKARVESPKDKTPLLDMGKNWSRDAVLSWFKHVSDDDLAVIWNWSNAYVRLGRKQRELVTESLSLK